MSYKIEEIEGIGPAYGGKLVSAGIKTTDQLLKACKSPKGRAALSQNTGLSTAQLLKWTNMADLMRINGIGKQFGELLEASGVDTVKELKHRTADNLAAKMAEVNAAKALTRVSPGRTSVQKWIDQAKSLGAIITY